MKRQLTYILFLGVAIMVFSCSSPKYIYDSSSLKRQEELHNSRSANVLGGILMGTISVVSSAISETEIEWQPTEQQFKKLNLTNPTNDTLYVNMLTDIYWDKEDYCDFMDIRIPPQKKCKILVPVKANYNLYFSNTPDESDDELIEVNTDKLKSISLNPGLTVFNDSINLK